MLLQCCGKNLRTESTRTKSGRLALKAVCPECGKKKFKILESKHGNKVEKSELRAA